MWTLKRLCNIENMFDTVHICAHTENTLTLTAILFEFDALDMYTYGKTMNFVQ